MKKRIIAIALCLIVLIMSVVPCYADPVLVPAVTINAVANLVNSAAASYGTTVLTARIAQMLATAPETILAEAGFTSLALAPIVEASAATTLLSTVSIAIPTAAVLGLTAALNIIRNTAIAEAAYLAVAANMGTVVANGAFAMSPALEAAAANMTYNLGYFGNQAAAALLLGPTAVPSLVGSIALFNGGQVTPQQIFDCPLPVFINSPEIQADFDLLEQHFENSGEYNYYEYCEWILTNCPRAAAAAITEKQMFFFGNNPHFNQHDHEEFPVNDILNYADALADGQYLWIYANYYGGLPSLDDGPFYGNLATSPQSIIPQGWPAIGLTSDNWTEFAVPGFMPPVEDALGVEVFYRKSDQLFRMGRPNYDEVHYFHLNDGSAYDNAFRLWYYNTIYKYCNENGTKYNFILLREGWYAIDPDGHIIPVRDLYPMSDLDPNIPEQIHFPRKSYVIGDGLAELPYSDISFLFNRWPVDLEDLTPQDLEDMYFQVPDMDYVYDIPRYVLPDLEEVDSEDLPDYARDLDPIPLDELATPELGYIRAPEYARENAPLYLESLELNPMPEPQLVPDRPPVTEPEPEPDEGDDDNPPVDPSLAAGPWQIFKVPGKFADLFSKFLPPAVAEVFSAVLFAVVFYGLARLFIAGVIAILERFVP